jgi:hypothetical protein
LNAGGLLVSVVIDSRHAKLALNANMLSFSIERTVQPVTSRPLYTINYEEFRRAVTGTQLVYNDEVRDIACDSDFYPSEEPYTFPLYRPYSTEARYHLYTTNADERDSRAQNFRYAY